MTKIASGASLPTDVKISIVGNEEKGMLASTLTRKLIAYDGKDFTYFS
jgi:hypothetical protein